MSWLLPRRIYDAVAAVAVAGFASAGCLLALTIPFHDWDSFAFGEYSRSLALHGTFDPLSFGALGSARPLYYWLEGGVWSVTGVSFGAARVLSLLFGLLLVAAVFQFTRAARERQLQDVLQPAVAVMVVLAIVPFAQEALAGKSDVPAAALTALVAALSLRSSATRPGAAVLWLAASSAVLTKPTVLFPLAGLALYVGLRHGHRGIAGRLKLLPLVAGLLTGLAYDTAMALRFHTGLLSYLRTGTTDGLWAQRAASQRWDAILRADVLGQGLRLPLTFGLLYGILRASRIRHRRATFVALPIALAWSVAGPELAHFPGGAFASPEAGFTLIAFALLFLAAALVEEIQAPSANECRLALALGVPPLAVWAYSTPYFDRLAATAWPGLSLLLALAICAGIRGLGRFGQAATLAPVPILVLVVWMSAAFLDGLHGHQWVEYRSLGIDGIGNRERTMNIVLPAVQSALAVAEPQLGDGGRLVTEDPRFSFFLPNRVDTRFPLRCSDLIGNRVFILVTSDETQELAREAHGRATPRDWEECRSPIVHSVSEDVNGFQVFTVG